MAVWQARFRIATVLSCFASLVGMVGCHSAPKTAHHAEREEAQLELGPRWGSVHVARMGSPDAPKLLLVHGLGQSASRDFDAVLPALSAHFRVFTVDLPGFGRSPGTDHLCTPEDYADLVHEVVSREAGGPVSVLGHSMGGAIAIAYASKYASEVERLALLDVAGILHYGTYSRAVVAAMLNKGGAPLDSLMRAAAAVFRLGTGPIKVEMLSALGLPPSIPLLFIQHDFGAALHGVRAPVWIGWGELDEIAPQRTFELLRYVLRPALVSIYPRAGHLPMQTAPEQVAADVTRFLKSSPPPAASTPKAFSLSARRETCERETGRVIEGDYDTIVLDSCERAVLRNVRARSISLLHSTAVFSNVEIVSDGVGLTVAQSRIEWTGGTIRAATCVDAASSQLDLAALECHFSEQPFRIRDRTKLVASVCGHQHDGMRTSLHGEYSLAKDTDQ